jgi:hypothetical protein
VARLTVIEMSVLTGVEFYALVVVEMGGKQSISSEGQALLFAFFARLGGEVTHIASGFDYGRDFEIEVFRNQKTTAFC